MLCTTEETKRTLEMECEEAKFALKPWLIESTIVKKLDKNTCSCEDSLEQSDEIAEEIGKALLHSQQLREKLASNLSKERQESRKPNLRQIYAPSQPLKESNSNPKLRRSVSQHRPPDEQRQLKLRSLCTIKNGDENTPGRKSRLHARSQLRPSRDNSLARLSATVKSKSSQVNFIRANKLSVRNAKPPENNNQLPKCDLRNSRRNLSGPQKIKSSKSSEKSTSTQSDDVDTLNELDLLIKKFTNSTTMNSSEAKKNCPIHAENAPGIIEEKVITSVDAVEGLDRVGIPSILVNILKIYHAYVREEVFQEAPTILKKHQDAANNFLTNLEKLNEKHISPNLSKYQELLTGFSLLYSESFDLNLSKTQLRALKSRFINLGSLYDECNIKSQVGELKFSKSNVFYNEFIPDMKNWISNGIWNYLCIPNMKGIFGSHCLRYSDRNQLILLYDFIQTLQRKVYAIELMELLMMTVIPKLKQSLDPKSTEFIEMYKMIVTIIQILNPTVPVLAKIDNY